MADKLFGSEDFDVNRRDARGKWVVPWLLLLGFVIYELTAYPALAVGTVSLKFGWEDFRTALWLRRTDPLPLRARACFWLYLSFGLLKTAIAGGILMLVCVIVGTAIQIRQANAVRNVPSAEFDVAIVTAMGGFMLATVSACIAMFKAWRARIKVWLSDTVHVARRQDHWPPPNLSPAIPNQARAVLLAAVINISTVLILSLLPLFFLIGEVANATVSACCTAAALIIVPVFLFGLAAYISRHLAACPSECWGTARIA